MVKVILRTVELLWLLNIYLDYIKSLKPFKILSVILKLVFVETRKHFLQKRKSTAVSY